MCHMILIDFNDFNAYQGMVYITILQTIALPPYYKMLIKEPESCVPNFRKRKLT